MSDDSELPPPGGADPSRQRNPRTAGALPAGGLTAGSLIAGSLIVGGLIVAAAVAHAMMGSRGSRETAAPLHVGRAVGEILVREQGGVAHHKCSGFKVECYESFALVYVDKSKEPTWTGNFVKVIPWSKIEHLTLADPSAAP